jgi:anti-sigma regulatory factor (Ser/Thr protein kinase)
MADAVTDAVAIDLPLEAGSARRARERLEPFRKPLGERSFFDLRLLVSELVVEALNIDSGTEGATIELRAELRDDRVHVEVADGGAAFRLPSRRPEPGEAGWGLHLVQRLSSRWGVRREPERASVWLEMPLAG